jgi:hypothetical protein
VTALVSIAIGSVGTFVVCPANSEVVKMFLLHRKRVLSYDGSLNCFKVLKLFRAFLNEMHPGSMLAEKLRWAIWPGSFSNLD